MNPSDIHIAVMYKNFAAWAGISHIGLGVSAMNTCKVLRESGIDARVIPLKLETELGEYLTANPQTTHVVVQAPWISTAEFSKQALANPNVQFAMVSHSNVGFLQADRNGIKLIKEDLQLETGLNNFHVGGNSKRFCKWVENSFGDPCTYLPNLYHLHHLHGQSRPGWPETGGVLKIGAFGATRTLKNYLSAIGAAMEMSRDLGAQTEVWINSERNDGPESKVIRSAGMELVAGLPDITIKEAPWAAWPVFKKLVGSMHLLLQPSYTESFNMVTADGISEGVPSVVSSAITWAPAQWQADVDDVNDIARVGVALLQDNRAVHHGFEALKHHNRDGKRAWFKYLLDGQFGVGE